jgi:lysyl endopeptidase
MKRALGKRSALIGLALAVIAPWPAALAQQGRAVIGTEESVAVGTAHPYPPGVGADAWQYTFSYPGASYIRVHFSQFDLAPGDSLTISNPVTGESDVYTGRGPFGTGSFWAFSVESDMAVLVLDAPTGGVGGIEIDSLGRGTQSFTSESSPSPELVCGTTDWRDVKCYQTSNPTEYQRATGVAKIIIGGAWACTAFKVSDSGQFLTNDHCIASTTEAQATEVLLNYQNSLCNGGTLGYSAKLMGSQMLKTDGILDYTLFTTLGDSSSIPCLTLDPRLPPVGERIYLAGHPLALPKKLTIASDQDPGGLCMVNASPYQGLGPVTDVGYHCDTEGGASGSPVLSGVTHTVVALHHLGGCDVSTGALNSGARMDLICPQLAGVLGTCGGRCGPADSDGDTVGDCCDNCPGISNATQTDSDGDLMGDPCDPCPLDALNDAERDGFCANVDNCPGVYNPSQLDSDSDGLGDACDLCPLGPCPSPDAGGPTPTPQPGKGGPSTKKIM